MPRSISNILLIVSIIYSALIPSGYMPHFDENGFSINICEGGSFGKKIIDRDHPNYETMRIIHDLQNPSDDEQIQNDCAFTAALNFIILPDIFSHEKVKLEAVNIGIILNFIQIMRISGLFPPSTGPPKT